MKKYIILLICIFCVSNFIHSKDRDSINIDIPQPKEGKSLVYFIRQGGGGMLIGFKIFDSENFVGNLKQNNYIVYECDPGKHVFIAKSENTDYLEANLEEGKVYVVYTEMKMGVIKARVKLKPIHKNIKNFDKERKRIFKLLAKDNKGKSADDEEELTEEDDTQGRKAQKFSKKKKNNDKMTQLAMDMYFE